MSSTSPTEARELDLVGKVELRIALADTDQKLETLLKTYLAPLLLKLASEHVAVRNKVISVCQHINTRIKPQAIQLPVAALLKQFKEHGSTPLIRHFDILYVQQGVSRLPVSERLDLLPTLISGLSEDAAKSSLHGAQLFNLLLRLLGHFRLPPRGGKEDQELRTRLGVSDEDGQFLSKWFGKLILFTVAKEGRCPGLSTAEYEFLTLQKKPGVWDPKADGGLNLAETKVMVTKFVASGIFTDKERFLPGLFASADTNSRISEVGEDVLKRTLPATDLEDHSLVENLFEIYFGSSGVDGQAPVRTPLRIKILSILSKSVISTTFADSIVRLVQEGLINNGSVDESSQSAGRELSKLRSAIFTYVNFVARRGSPGDLHKVAPRVVQKLGDFIENQGWPENDNGDAALRGTCYEVLGLLAKSDPEEILLEPNLTWLRFFFSLLRKEKKDRSVIVSTEEALSSMLNAFSGALSTDIQDTLRHILLEQMQPDDHGEYHSRNRYVAVRYCNRCLPYGDPAARWIDILAIGGAPGDTQEIAEEGRRGLDPHWYRMLNGHGPLPEMRAEVRQQLEQKFQFPSFTELVKSIFGSKGVPDSEMTQASARDSAIRLLSSNHKAAEAAASFCRQILYSEALQSAGAGISVDSDWSRKLDSAAASDEESRSSIKTYIRGLQSDGLWSMGVLLQAFFELLTREGMGSQVTAGEKLIELCTLASEATIQILGPRAKELLPVVLSNDQGSRTVASHLYGVLSKDEVDTTTLKSLVARASSWKDAVGADANKAHGSILALAYYFPRRIYADNHEEASSSTFIDYLQVVFQIVEEGRDKMQKEASYVAVDQLCLFHILAPQDIKKHIAFNTLVDKLSTEANTGNEKAIGALGRLGMILPDAEETSEEPELAYLEEKMHKLHEIRQAESQFAVGEALSCLAAGWDSKALATKLDVEGPVPKSPKHPFALDRIFKKTLEGSKNTKPALRKASVIWLLCLLQYCGQQPEVKSNLRECQLAFKRCLSDRDELVQEAAARGLGLVYESGDRELKDDLVRDLVGSFSGERSQLSGNVTEDTQLFEPGALPTGDGSITTYKDIMSLASEVGDSSLVYRFMSLASNNAIWSSRAAFGRFGLSTVFSDSSVDGYLANNPKLYPKLYRYRFDPNPNVQRSMNDIWNALVKDSSATIEAHFDDIMQDLLKSIVGREWRVRQASCAAVADLVQGRPLEKYEKYLGDIWTLSFKVLDDIKESVRAAAATLARVLTGILTRSLEAGESSRNADAMLQHVLPFLLSTSGLESSAQEVQAFSLHTLLDIIKKSSGVILRPFIPELVERLLGLLSSLEPEAVNYIHLNAAKYNLTEQKIDDMRLMSVRGSPLMEAVERCLDLLDEPTMKLLQPRLEAAMKSSVGLPSKVGCSRVLVSLSTRRNFLFRPYADSFLKLIEKYVLDRNDTVSSSYAAAAGYVARTASDQQILQLVSFSKQLYFDSEDDRYRGYSGEIIYAISKYATDRFTALNSDLLPFVFVAKQDENEHVKEPYQNTWSENVGGSRAVQLYLKEIMIIAQAHINSARWVLKHASARAIAEATTATAPPGGEISLANAETLWPALCQAMAGKTWEGKEVVLQAFVKFIECSPQFWRSRKDIADEIQKIIIREARRQNKEYRPFALRAIGEVARARNDLDLSDVIFEIVSHVVDELVPRSDESAMEVDGGEEAMKADRIRDKTLVASIETLSDAINVDHLQIEGVTPKIVIVLELTGRTSPKRLAAGSPVLIGRFTALTALADKLTKHLDEVKLDHTTLFASNVAEVQDKWLALLLGPKDGLSEAVRVKRAEAILAFSKIRQWSTELQQTLDMEIGEEKSPLVRKLLEQARAAQLQ